MIAVRKAADRGHAEHGWLDSWHTFSFGDYYDPKHMGFRSLRVINEDRVAAGKGFPTHPHRDMEILTYVLDGALEHKDSMGNGSVMRPGDVQRMTAGTGVAHSEFNGSRENAVHFLQIWILPESRNLEPGYEQKNFTAQDKQGKFKVVASRDGADGAVLVHQDMTLLAGLFAEGEQTQYALAAGRSAWLHVARGKLRVNGVELGAGDALQVSDETALDVTGVSDAEALLFDLS
ncbi:MAG TPA: pirin family protein [Polyangiaceae bacterium]|jgi:redox-sensitive bicupin YhaK (pirin superfamily)|nr:pirin family protein [Polyangiaceae bacterium]